MSYLIFVSYSNPCYCVTGFERVWIVLCGHVTWLILHRLMRFHRPRRHYARCEAVKQSQVQRKHLRPPRFLRDFLLVEELEVIVVTSGRPTTHLRRFRLCLPDRCDRWFGPNRSLMKGWRGNPILVAAKRSWVLYPARRTLLFKVMAYVDHLASHPIHIIHHQMTVILEQSAVKQIHRWFCSLHLQLTSSSVIFSSQTIWCLSRVCSQAYHYCSVNR